MADQRITIHGDRERRDRSEIRFGYSASEIRQAARKRAEYHEERTAWWQQQHGQAEQELRESMQLREHQVTGGVQHAAVFDSEKQERLSQCRAKLEQHKRQAEEYRAWEAGMRTLASTNVWLDVADIQFFGLHGYEEEDE